MPEWLGLENLTAFLTLAALEIVLGVDNIVFIAIITGRVRENLRSRARRIGLFLAMFMRVGLLLALSWIMGLTEPLFTILGRAISGRDLILLGGGVFLIAKATFEMHENIEGGHRH